MDPTGTSTLDLGGKGQLVGSLYPNGVRSFAAIPYALSPTGARRWKKPVPLPEDYVYGAGEPLDCTKFKGVCPQPAYIVDDKHLNNPSHLRSEDCLVLNMWLPPSALKTNDNLPVLVYIHGGWLQIGDASLDDHDQPIELIAEGGLNAIVISISYRLNIFGFLAGYGVTGNFGFWDQRCALEWIQKYSSLFNGDSNRVTLCGLSAGAFSTNVQLNYELLQTDGKKPLFQNVWMISNAIPAQPKSISEANNQLEDVFSVFEIPSSLSNVEKLNRLREIPATSLVDKLFDLKVHTFRAVTDNEMIPEDMMKKFREGEFAARFKARGMRLLIGEAESEEVLYSLTNPPKSKQESEMLLALNNYYAADVCQNLLSLYTKEGKFNEGSSTDVKEAQLFFGRIVSDVQVRVPIRALCAVLHAGGVPAQNIARYRVAYRPDCVDKVWKREYGVTHSVDCILWWFVKRLGFTSSEELAAKNWLQQTLIPFVSGKSEAVNREPLGLKQYLYLNAKGEIKVTDDQYWNWLMRVYETLHK